MCENKQASPLKILKHDPYKEFELYLQKAQNEIGEIFQDSSPSLPTPLSPPPPPSPTTTTTTTTTIITNVTRNNDVITLQPTKEPSKGVKVLAQLEALLQGLSRTQETNQCRPKRALSERRCDVQKNSNICSMREDQQRGLLSDELKKGLDTRTTRAVDIDELSEWVENLVHEMNKIEDEDDEEKARKRKRDTLVGWLLGDLEATGNGSGENGVNDEEDEVFEDACEWNENEVLKVDGVVSDGRENGLVVVEGKEDTDPVPEEKEEIGDRPIGAVVEEKGDGCQVSRMSSTTSTLSSTGSQMKPEDVQDFIRRVETSIWESESLKRRKKYETEDSDDVFLPEEEEDDDDEENIESLSVIDVATQTTPCVSRTSSLILEEPGESQVDESEGATAGSIRSVSCSSIDILSTLSAPSSFGEEPTDVSSSDTTQCNGENVIQPKGAVKIMGNENDILRTFPKTYEYREDVWVKREVLQNETKVKNSVSSGSTSVPEVVSSDSTSCETPSPQIVRETRSDSNISRDNTKTRERYLLLRTPFSAPSSVATSPLSDSSPSTAPVLENPDSVLNAFNIAPKSSSAPILDERNLSLPTDGAKIDNDSATQTSPIIKTKVIPPLRSQSVKELAELEAVEACNWLRAAGFPQYAQMFEDMQFPINIAAVQKDHYFLDADSLQSLFRRLNTLNKCARMRLDNIPRKSTVEDSDEEDQCALSENWTFQRQSRRWSRIPSCLDPCVSHDPPNKPPANGHKSPPPSPSSTTPVDKSPLPIPPQTPPLDARCSAFKRSGSDRLKDGARAFLRRMESFKTRHSKRRNREAVVISGPQVMDTDGMEQRVNQLSCVDLTPSPQLIHRMNVARNRSLSQPEESASNSPSDTSQSSTPSSRSKRREFWSRGRSPSHPRSDSETGGLSDAECSPPTVRVNKIVDGEVFNFRTGSFHVGCEGCEKRTSVYDNIVNRKEESRKMLALEKMIVRDGKNIGEEKPNGRRGWQQDSDSGSSASTNLDGEAHKSSHMTTSNGQVFLHNDANLSNQKRKTSVISYQSSSSSTSLSINALSAGQLMILRKLSLLKLTALMERYSPSNRSGWSWIMPKFIKRMKIPDYKDKVVFGVPLSVIHQRTGQPLPPSIQTAILFLKKNAVDAVGIFRKSGVRSRIQKLKNMCEANPMTITYEGQQTYDVADMLKQYFRELPEALLTNKMSETFISIYQYIPEDLRLEALQSAVMLIPDENREILQKLLSFLSEVSFQSQENQMTASNLAVCFAPSLFHMNTSRSTSNSPRRRKTVGVPDQKELNENRAAHDCLTCMIRDHKRIFSVPDETVYQCRFSLVDETEPFAMDEILTMNGLESGAWKPYVHNSIQSLLKECREKVKGWMNVSTHENVELAFKKVGDGNPLRMWKTSIEVEAPPVELLNRVLRERQLWDEHLLKWRVVCKVDVSSEIFNYISNSMSPLPARDYCVLRSWRTDLPKGTCVLVESSINYSDPPLLVGNVRGMVMLSRYLIEPCGSGKSRITHISRVDTRGRSPEWYNRVYGHICALHLLHIGNSFRHNAEGPESKV